MNKSILVQKAFSITKRNLSTTTINSCTRNFDKFPMYEKRLLPREKDQMRTRKGRESQPSVWKVICKYFLVLIQI